MPPEKYIDWEFQYLPPSSYRGIPQWFFYFTKGQGVTVVRLLGFTVRVIK